MLGISFLNCSLKNNRISETKVAKKLNQVHSKFQKKSILFTLTACASWHTVQHPQTRQTSSPETQPRAAEQRRIPNSSQQP